jgi:hypothetical protein
MSFKNEMNQFFARNCFSEEQRARVKACPPYQRAEERDDVTEAQEIATRVLEAEARSRQEQKSS